MAGRTIPEGPLRMELYAGLADTVNRTWAHLGRAPLKALVRATRRLSENLLSVEKITGGQLCIVFRIKK